MKTDRTLTYNDAGKRLSVVPESTGGVTRQLSAKLPSTAGEWKGMSAVWGNADDLRLPVAAGEMPHSWDVPGVGDYVGNPSGVYGIVPGDIDHAITSQLTTDVKPTVSSSKAVAGGETYDIGASKVNPSGQTPKVSAGGGAGGTEIRNRYGQPVVPTEKTLDMALDPETYANAIADKYGINLRGSGENITIRYNPDLRPGIYGRTTAANPNVIEIGPDALISETELANTIAHELNHARSFLKGGQALEPPAYNSGNALSDYINGGR